MALRVITPPANEPLSLTEAKQQARVSVSDDDALILSLIKSAREYVERWSRRALITQTLELVLDEWPDGDEIILPRPPLQSVVSIIYTDYNGTDTTLPTSDYIVDLAIEPGRVVLAYGKSWPTVTLQPAAAIRVRYVAGYGDNTTDVPERYRQAIRLLVADMYENREASISTGAVPKVIPYGVERLLWPDRALRV